MKETSIYQDMAQRTGGSVYTVWWGLCGRGNPPL